MAKLINVGILLLVVASSLATTSEAAEHEVPWIIPTPTQAPSFYANLVANITFRVNDILVFNFTTGYHNVVTLSKKDFEACNVKEKIKTFNNGPAMIKLNGTGEFYFACAFPSHCTLGQKLSINVADSSSSSSSSSSSPSPAKAPSSQAGPGSPVSVTATFSLLLMATAISLLL